MKTTMKTTTEGKMICLGTIGSFTLEEDRLYFFKEYPKMQQRSKSAKRYSSRPMGKASYGGLTTLGTPLENRA